MSEAIKDKLSQYLQNIQEGKAINFDVFRDTLLKKNIPDTRINRLFRVELIKPKQYKIEILNQEDFSNLCQQVGYHNSLSRITAAFKGRSHKVAVSGSFLLLKSPYIDHPQVIIFDKESWFCPVESCKQLLLVENLENFLSYQKTIHLLKQWDLMPDTVFDIIFSAGNQINNSLHRNYLNAYEKVFCLFDLDVGALKTFKSLTTWLSKAHLEFIIPPNIIDRLLHSEWYLSSSERALLTKYTGLSHEIDHLIITMRDSGKKLEQETYLYPTN